MQHTVGERFCKEKRAKQASHVNKINKQSSNDAASPATCGQAWKFLFTNAEFLELQSFTAVGINKQRQGMTEVLVAVFDENYARQWSVSRQLGQAAVLDADGEVALNVGGEASGRLGKDGGVIEVVLEHVSAATSVACGSSACGDCGGCEQIVDVRG
jgi:hypothetical protein